MGSHPANLALRFALEVMALAAFGMWGWHMGGGWLKYVQAVGYPLAMGIVWGTFAVHNDPSRSGNAPVPIPGVLRLLLELAIFGGATAFYVLLGYSVIGWTYGIVTLVHYLLSNDRVAWLVRQ